MSIFMKMVVPMTVFALFVSGCDQGQQARPGTNFTPPPPPSDEEVAQWEKAILDFHKGFKALLITSTESLRSSALINDFGRPAGNLKAAETFLEQIDTLDVSACPDYYRKAYDPLKEAWVDFFKLVVKNQGDLKKNAPMQMSPLRIEIGLGGFGESFDGLNSSDQEYRDAMAKITEITKEYCRAVNPRGSLVL